MKQTKRKKNNEITAGVILELALYFLFIKALTFLTRFWPFSEFFRGRRFHYCNRRLVKWSDRIQDVAYKLHKPVRVYFVDNNHYYYIFKTKLLRTKKKVSDRMLSVSLKKNLKLSDTDIFIRREKNNEREIFIPKELINIK